MTQQLQHSWVKEIFNPDELTQYLKFENKLKNNPTPKSALKKSGLH